jgi:hypothetical protein
MTDKKKADQSASPKKSQLHDTSGDAQRLGPVDTFRARSELNIVMPAARGKELRDRGHDVRRQLITLADDQGRLHHGVAQYYMSTSANPTQAEA